MNLCLLHFSHHVSDNGTYFIFRSEFYGCNQFRLHPAVKLELSMIERLHIADINQAA